MKKQLLLLTALMFTNSTHCDFRDYFAQQTSYENNAARNNVIFNQTASTATTASTSQQCAASDASSATAIPSLTIALQDTTGTILYSTQFATSTSFTVNNAILIVNIFPPSTSSTDGSYYIVCTLKSLSGAVMQKQIFPTPTSPQTTPLTFKTIPSSVAIYTGITPNSDGTVTIPANTQPLAASTFMPPAYTTAAQQTQFLNIISPISQEFLLHNSSNPLTASGTFGSIESAASTSSPTSIILPSSGTTSGNQAVPISVSISDGSSPQTLTFTDAYFSSADSVKGLCLTTHIFPPSSSGSNYLLIATIKTLDGYKIQKQIMNNVSFSSSPSNIAIAYSGTTITSYNFADANSSTGITSSAFNIKSPVVIKTILQSHNGTVTALIL